jgi:ATP-dependent RNA helicase SUPV3L1/SUV3
MGLNLDIRHVAFAATAKYDGRRMRPLFPHEIGQIAGRAGRHTDNGSFGVTGEARPFDEELIDAIENHRFAPVRKLHWRNEVLEFGTAARLIGSLEAPTSNDWLTRARDSDDVLALKALSEMPEIRDKLRSPPSVRLLWDVCRIPDFRSISEAEHAGLLARIFGFLADNGQVPTDWLATNIARIDKTDGDIDAISKRLAYIRTWTYVAQRKGWVADESHWRDETRAVEDRLSDALHARLTQRFVDRRTSVLMRRLKQKESLVAEVNDKGEVAVEGEFVGRLEGFRFRQDASASPDEARTLRQAAYEALKPEFHLRADRFYNAPDTELDFTEQGGLMWGASAVGKLIAGAEALKPQAEAFVDEEAGFDVADKVRRRLQHFIDRKVATQFEPLLAMGRDETLQGLARGFAFRLVEGLGVLPREAVADDVKALDQDSRSVLRRHGVRFGQFTIFLPLMLKPAPTRLRLVLWSLANGLQEFPESPPPGLVTIPYLTEVPKNHYTLAGYHPAGSRAIRIDMLERLADLLRAKDSRAGFEATPDMLSITGMTLDQFADLMAGLGYRGDKSERPKIRPEAAAAVTAKADAATEGAVGEAPVDAAAVPADDGAEPPVAEAVLTPPPGTEPVDATPAPDEADAAPAAAVEMESFYTFVWAPRPRGGENRGPRRERPEARGRSTRAAAPAQAQGDAAAQAPAGDPPARPNRPPRNDRPEGGERRKDGPRDRSEGFKGKPKPKGGKPGDRGDRPDHNERPDRPRDTQPKVFEARPPREQKIDPDNPFAVLAALKTRI